MHYILNVHYRFLKYESAKHLFPLRHSEVEVQSSIKWKYSLKNKYFRITPKYSG